VHKTVDIPVLVITFDLRTAIEHIVYYLVNKLLLLLLYYFVWYRPIFYGTSLSMANGYDIIRHIQRNRSTAGNHRKWYILFVPGTIAESDNGSSIIAGSGCLPEIDLEIKLYQIPRRRRK